MKLLIADDDSSICQSVKLILSDLPYEVIESSDLDQAYHKIIQDQPDLILLDIHFKEKTSLDLIRRLVAENYSTPIIILSGAASAAEAAEAIKLGVYDFIEKPISADRLRLTVQHCIENTKLKQTLHQFTVPTNDPYEIVGKSKEITKIKKQILQFGNKEVKVLITGETGTGKEIIAYNIWKVSERSNRPFIIVNSAAIPDSLLESELFGHRKGSFTGAVSDQVGKIEMADRGTLFLDEIGDLSLNAQTKLLRFLESGEIQKVGSNQCKKVDVRLIAATSRDLEKEMELGRFRSDLYYRLNVVRISIPPLRERAEDIGPLFFHFIEGFCSKFHEESKLIDPEVIQELKCHSWPGNIRELRNIAERLVLLSGPRILKEHLNQVWKNLPRQNQSKTSSISLDALDILPLKEFKNKLEKEYLEKVISVAQGSITRAAQLLQIDRTYLHQKMSHHGISTRTVLKQLTSKEE